MDEQHENQLPDWLDEFEVLANEQLEEGSACDQVHPIVARWYDEVMEGDPPESRDSVWQAMQCLTTEVVKDAPPELAELLGGESEPSEALADWITEVLLVGRAFQMALDSGRLDDL
jgi:hypothetical protein